MSLTKSTGAHVRILYVHMLSKPFEVPCPDNVDTLKIQEALWIVAEGDKFSVVKDVGQALSHLGGKRRYINLVLWAVGSTAAWVWCVGAVRLLPGETPASCRSNRRLPPRRRQPQV